MIGWIPRFDNLADLPAGHNYPDNFAMRLLFNSGNPTPPSRFLSFRAFDTWINHTKEYRAAIYIKDVRLFYLKGDPSPKLDYVIDGFIGFTPPRLIVQGTNLVPWPLSRYQIGRGAVSTVDGALPGNQGVYIKHRIQFKLGAILDLFTKQFLTGQWAPSAWMELDYRIYRNGSVEVTFKGSAIPSQALYVNWSNIHQRDMIANSLPEINGFMNSQGCTKAPQAFHFLRSDQATMC